MFCTLIGSAHRWYIMISLSFFFFLMIRPPPRSTLFPYPPLFRSAAVAHDVPRHTTRRVVLLHPFTIAKRDERPAAREVLRGAAELRDDRRIRPVGRDEEIGRAHV